MCSQHTHAVCASARTTAGRRASACRRFTSGGGVARASQHTLIRYHLANYRRARSVGRWWPQRSRTLREVETAPWFLCILTIMLILKKQTGFCWWHFIASGVPRDETARLMNRGIFVIGETEPRWLCVQCITAGVSHFTHNLREINF